MPGSLLSRVRRSDSARSDRSDVSAKSGDSWKSSGKKVSFNRAVRVKKFPKRADALHDEPDDLDEKRFWFKVYKNGNRDQNGSLRRRHTEPIPDREVYANLPIRPLAPIAEIPPHSHKGHSAMRLTADVGVGTSGDALHSSQTTETPTVRRNHVKKLVTRFNEEALIKFSDEEPSSPTLRTHNGRPPEPPVDYVEGKQKRNPLVNGVKVIFGMANLKNKRNQNEKTSDTMRKNQANLRKNLFGEDRKSNKYENGPPYRTSILLADEYATTKNNNNIYNKNHNYGEGDGRLSLVETNNRMVPAHFWDFGDQLVSDVTRFESTLDKNDMGGQTQKTVEEGNRVWKHETRTIYEEESPPVLLERRKAKSHSDLRGDSSLDSRLSNRKGLSIDDLSGRRGVTRDMAIQCNRSREREMAPSSYSTLPSNHRVIRPRRDGFVSAYSDVPSIKVNGTAPQPKTQEAIYSQVDKNKKLLDKKSASTLSLNSRNAKVKSSQKSFGFRLKKAFGATLPDEKVKGNTYSPAKDEEGNWYDVDADVVAADERKKGHHDIGEVRLELADEKIADSSIKDESNGREVPGTVVREMDHRKREIIYENTPTRSKTEAKTDSGGLWYRGAEEDYRREMAQSDVSYPSALTLGRSSFLTGSRDTSLPSKAYTLDRRHMHSKSSTSLNGSHTRSKSPTNLNGSHKRSKSPPNLNGSYTRSKSPTNLNGSYTRSKSPTNLNGSYTRSKSPTNLNGSYTRSKSPTNLNGHTHSKSPTNLNGSITHSKSTSKSSQNGSAIKILVNGKEVDDLDGLTTSRVVQSRRKIFEPPRDSTSRGGLAAAYKARQKAALRRSNSLSGSRHSVSGLGVSSGASSTASASSDGESSRRRRTLVMYIPGIDHTDHRSDSDDRRSWVSRTQSLHTNSRPSKYQKHARKGSAHPRYVSSRNASDASTAPDEEGDTLTPLRSDKGKGSQRKGDLRRRHSMPKDTKFGWFKWKIKPKSRDT